MRDSKNRQRVRHRLRHRCATRRLLGWLARGVSANGRGSRCHFGKVRDRVSPREVRAPTASALPGLGRVHEAGETITAWRPVENVEIVTVAFRIDLDERLIEQRIFGCAIGGVDHEVRAGLATYLCGAVD